MTKFNLHILHKTSYKLTELLVLYVLLPVVLFLDVALFLKVIGVFVGVVYITFISLRLRLFSLKQLLQFNGLHYWKSMLLIFTIIVVTSYVYMNQVYPDKLFVVIKKSPWFWLGLTLFYSIFSVLPQEFIYRSFFFERYAGLCNKSLLVALNLLVFPIAHLFFHNWLVLLITAIGGALFTLSYLKTKSLLLTTVEHAIYGSWLFTIGMGELLGFPLPQ